MEKECIVCNKEFNALYERTICCSPKCSGINSRIRNYMRKNNISNYDKAKKQFLDYCIRKSNEKKSKDKPKKIIKRECKCITCGKIFETSHPTKKRCDRCMVKSNPVYEKVCWKCKKKFTTPYSRKQICDECMIKAAETKAKKKKEYCIKCGKKKEDYDRLSGKKSLYCKECRIKVQKEKLRLYRQSPEYKRYIKEYTKEYRKRNKNKK